MHCLKEDVVISNQLKKYLDTYENKCYSYGLIFTAAAQFEERIGNIKTALQICEDGLEYNCSHGPLWFLLIKLAARVGDDYRFRFAADFDSLLEEAIRYKTEYGHTRSAISPELRWKIYLEAAQYQETNGKIDLARKYLMKSTMCCNNQKLKWKIWIIGAKIETRIGSMDTAKSLIERSLLEMPQKKQNIGLLEYAKYYEMIGKVETSYKILYHAQRAMESDWKIFFKSVLAYMRNGKLDSAEKLIKVAINKHFFVGRLWATLIQLKHAKIKNVFDSKKAFKVNLRPYDYNIGVCTCSQKHTKKW